MNGFPLLSVITYLPLAGAIVIFAVPHISANAARWGALAIGVATFLLSLLLLTGDFAATGMRFEERVEWLPEVGVSYHLGVDGLSTLLVILTTLLTPISILVSWSSVSNRVREFHIAMLLLVTGMIGAFVSLDLFLFYVFFELSLIPMALIIGIWGSPNRVYAAIKFFLFTLAGSLLMLVAIVATYQRYFQATGQRSLDILALTNPPGGVNSVYPVPFQYWVFAAFFVAFAIKVPMWPLHTWLPDAHTEAPTAGSVMLAGVMLKLGGYGMLRFCLPLYPLAARYFAPAILVLSTIAIIYGALVALPQPDWKRLVAYSSVSHMGFVTLGIFSFNEQALQGATMVMFAHGLNTAALFLLVGMIYERAHTREIARFRDLSTTMPIFAAIFMAFTFASIGLPGMSGFVGEFHALLGAWRGGTTLHQTVAVISTAVVILSAWYMLWLFQRVGQYVPPARNLALASGVLHHDPSHDLPAAPAIGGGSQAHNAPPAGDEQHRVAHGHGGHHGPYPDLNGRELVTLAPLLALTIFFGVYPGPIFQLVSQALRAILLPFGV